LWNYWNQLQQDDAALCPRLVKGVHFWLDPKTHKKDHGAEENA
jgi:hypothetical protein